MVLVAVAVGAGRGVLVAVAAGAPPPSPSFRTTWVGTVVGRAVDVARRAATAELPACDPATPCKNTPPSATISRQAIIPIRARISSPRRDSVSDLGLSRPTS